jgi:hypothetical protein
LGDYRTDQKDLQSRNQHVRKGGKGMRLAILFLMTVVSSCCSTYLVTDFNTTGVVTNFRKIESPDGDVIYTVLISKEERAYAQYITTERFQIGDTVIIKAKMMKLK